MSNDNSKPESNRIATDNNNEGNESGTENQENQNKQHKQENQQSPEKIENPENSENSESHKNQDNFQNNYQQESDNTANENNNKRPRPSQDANTLNENDKGNEAISNTQIQRSIPLSDNNNVESTKEPSNTSDIDVTSKPSTTTTLPSTARHSEFYVLHKQKGDFSINRRCHLPRSEGVNVKARRKLIIASILCLFFVICEIIGGIISNSLAVAADAAHTLTDFAGFMISLFAIWLAGRQATDRLSFGWYRAEVIGALVSVMTIWFVTAILFWLAVQRCITGTFEIGAMAMVITSIFGIITNIILGIYLSYGGTSTVEMDCNSQDNLETRSQTLHSGHGHGHHGHQHCLDCFEKLQIKCRRCFLNKRRRSHDIDPERVRERCEQKAENINVKSAYLHVLGDGLQSVSVLIAGITIWLQPTWIIVDPICTFIFSVIILYTTFNILKDIIVVLMEGTPTYMDYNQVQQTIEQIPGVKSIHHLRIWALSLDKVALAVHLVIERDSNPQDILRLAEEAIHRHYNLFETTIQIEEEDESIKEPSEK